jgi:hypothetical protein
MEPPPVTGTGQTIAKRHSKRGKLLKVSLFQFDTAMSAAELSEGNIRKEK